MKSCPKEKKVGGGGEGREKGREPSNLKTLLHVAIPFQVYSNPTEVKGPHQGHICVLSNAWVNIHKSGGMR